MWATEGASGNSIVADPLTLTGPNGRIVRSFAIRDRGIDPLIYFNFRQNILRILLGDMRFVGCFDRDRRLLKLFFVPEYPSEEYQPVREFLTYYGILVSQYAEADKAVYQLRAWDDRYRRIEWHEGVQLLSLVDREGLSDFQTLLVDKIARFDESLTTERVNLPPSEMRKLVGSATGGRLELKPFVAS